MNITAQIKEDFVHRTGPGGRLASLELHVRKAKFPGKLLNALEVQRPLKKLPFEKIHWISNDFESRISGDYSVNGLWLPRSRKKVGSYTIYHFIWRGQYHGMQRLSLDPFLLIRWITRYLQMNRLKSCCKVLKSKIMFDMFVQTNSGRSRFGSENLHLSFNYNMASVLGERYFCKLSDWSCCVGWRGETKKCPDVEMKLKSKLFRLPQLHQQKTEQPQTITWKW